jgi:hypothetical protein
MVLRDAADTHHNPWQGIDSRGPPVLDRSAEDIAKVIGRERGAIVLLAHDPRRLVEAAALDVPPSSQAILTAARSSYRALALWPNAGFPCSPASVDRRTRPSL